MNNHQTQEIPHQGLPRLSAFRVSTSLRCGCTVKDQCTDCENKFTLSYCLGLMHPIMAGDIPVPTPTPKGTPVPPRKK